MTLCIVVLVSAVYKAAPCAPWLENGCGGPEALLPAPGQPLHRRHRPHRRGVLLPLELLHLGDF